MTPVPRVGSGAWFGRLDSRFRQSSYRRWALAHVDDGNDRSHVLLDRVKDSEIGIPDDRPSKESILSGKKFRIPLDPCYRFVELSLKIRASV